jgi:hypothetical protein
MEVRVMDLSSPQEDLGPVDFIKGSVTEAELVMEACRGFSVAFHLVGRIPQARLSEDGFW